MIIYRKQKSRIVKGSGLFDWLGAAAGKVGNFISNNSGLIKNIANVVGDVTKAGATTATSVKQIVDLVKASKAKAASQMLPKAALQAPAVPPAAPAVLHASQPPLVVPPALQSALNQKSVDILNNLITGVGAQGSPGSAGSVGVSGAGFKTLSGKGMYLNSGRGLYLTK
jgi:hypothetical protein